MLVRRAPLGLSTEAGRGQMLRGGLSWPPDWNVGAGAAKRGKTVELAADGVATEGTAHMSGVAAQDDTQCRPLSKPSWSWLAHASSGDAVPCASWSCDVTTVCVCEAGCCSHTTTAAASPRRGSSIASSTRTKIRNDFTGMRLARSRRARRVERARPSNGRPGCRVDSSAAVRVPLSRDDWGAMLRSIDPPTGARSILDASTNPRRNRCKPSV